MRELRFPHELIETLNKVHRFMQRKGRDCFLVGGLLRDQQLSRLKEPFNIDFAVLKKAVSLSEEFARELNGAFVLLDESEGIGRVVLTINSVRIELDFADFKGPDIKADLNKRDFTINAMAIKLGDWIKNPEGTSLLIDPLGGQKDIRNKKIIPCFEGACKEDPLRILRALRFSAQLKFTIDKKLIELMKKAVNDLAGIAGERIRDELLKIFETDKAGSAISMLEEIGALTILIPELDPSRGMDQGDFHHLDVLKHQIEAVSQADSILSKMEEFSSLLKKPLMQYCAQGLVLGRSRKALIKLAALIHDVGKPAHKKVHEDGEIWFIGHEHTGAKLSVPIAKRLRLASREEDMVKLIVRHHLRPGFLSREPTLTRRAIYRFYKDLGDNGPACLLAWWCDRMATRGSKSHLDKIPEQRARLEEMLNPYFFKAKEVISPPRFIDGNQLMEALDLSPGKKIGELLNLIEESQASGQINSKEEALSLAREYLKGNN